jgi:hypothetical protein
MTSMDPMDTATCYFAQVPQRQMVMCLLHKIQAGPQLCSLLCASGQCGGCALSRQPLGLPLHLRDSQPSLPVASLILLHRSLVSFQDLSCCVRTVVVPETLLNSPSLITTYTRSIRLQQRCGSELVLLQTKLIATQNTMHP